MLIEYALRVAQGVPHAFGLARLGRLHAHTSQTAFKSIWASDELLGRAPFVLQVQIWINQLALGQLLQEVDRNLAFARGLEQKT